MRSQWCENVQWGHVSTRRLALEGRDHFPTLEVESESNCVLPRLITGWEDRPSQPHNSIWAKYLDWGGTTSLVHNTSIHIRGRAARGAESEWPARVAGGTSLLPADFWRDKLSGSFVQARVHDDLFHSCFWGDSLFVSDWEESCQRWVSFYFCTLK